jgi:glycerol uptake facilitator-like aquaporin
MKAVQKLTDTFVVTEFFGCLYFVFIIGLSSGPNAPLCIGFALSSMIFMGGHISGGHYNPAVTIAVNRDFMIGVHFLLLAHIGAHPKSFQ